MSFKGGCLCGQLRYESPGPALFIGCCYCADCQKETGSGHTTVVAVPEATLKIDGRLTEYHKPGDSGKNVARAFCATCGTTIYGKAEAMPGGVGLRVGTLDDSSSIKPMMSVFAGSAQAWDMPPTGIPAFPKMPGG